MNIYIPIEVKARELEGKTLLALAAAERGHTVILGDKSSTRSLAAKGVLPPGILHNKSLTPSEKAIKLLDNLKKHGHVITCQDEESGLIDESYEPFARLRFSEESIQKTDRVFGWGRHDTNALKKLFPELADKFTATGSPRVDFWRDDLHAYYDSGPVSEKAKSLKPFILISSNFSAFLNQNRFFDVIARLRDANYFDRTPEWEQHQYDNYAYQSRLIFEFIKLIRRLSAQYPSINILVRPHPVETVSGWKKALGTFPNVHVIREGAIGNWLNECALLVHNGCTTAIEAAAFGKPRIAFRPLPNPIERDIPNKISYQVFGIEECIDFVSKILNKKNIQIKEDIQQSQKEILGMRFTNLEGTLAAERIVDVWEEIGVDLQNSHAHPKDIYLLKNGIKSVLKQQIQKYKKVLKPNIRNNRKLLKSDHKFAELTEYQIGSLIENIQSSTGKFKNVDRKKFGEKSYLLFNKNVNY